MSRYRATERKLYIGDLGAAASRQELEDTFAYYGPIRDVWVARNPPGFAFIEYEDARDAEDAKRALDGRTVCGRRVRVEMSNGRGSRGISSRGGGIHSDDRCYECGENGHFARDCRRRIRGRRRSYSPRRRSRSYSRSRSRSPRRTRTRSRTRSRSRSRSRGYRSRSKSLKSRSASRSGSRGRSRSKSRD